MAIAPQQAALSKSGTDKLRPRHHSKHRKALTTRKVAVMIKLHSKRPATSNKLRTVHCGSWGKMLPQQTPAQAAPTTTSPSAAASAAVPTAPKAT